MGEVMGKINSWQRWIHVLHNLDCDTKIELSRLNVGLTTEQNLALRDRMINHCPYPVAELREDIPNMEINVSRSQSKKGITSQVWNFGYMLSEYVL